MAAKKTANVVEAEMHRVFNCGIGMVAIVAAEDAGRAQQVLKGEGESVFRIGEIRPRAGDEPQTVCCRNTG